MKINREKYELAAARSCKGYRDLVAAGIPKGTLCRVLGGQNAKPETIGKIAKVFGCDVLELID